MPIATSYSATDSDMLASLRVEAQRIPVMVMFAGKRLVGICRNVKLANGYAVGTMRSKTEWTVTRVDFQHGDLVLSSEGQSFTPVTIMPGEGKTFRIRYDPLRSRVAALREKSRK